MAVAEGPLDPVTLELIQRLVREQETRTVRTADYYDGYEEGWIEAGGFIVRHPHGIPWSALADVEEEPAEGDYERGQQDGWKARMNEKGWPTSRREASE